MSKGKENARTRARKLYRALSTRDKNKRLKMARHLARLAAKAVKLTKYKLRLAKSHRVIINRAYKRARATLVAQ